MDQLLSRRRTERGLHAGQQVTVRFEALDLEGLAVGQVGDVLVSAPYGIPGEEAVVEITEATRFRARGKIVSILRKSPDVAAIQCRHFGRCGGCQWQHITYPVQLRYKTRLVKEYLKEALDLRRDLVQETLPSNPIWGYRHQLVATFQDREGQPVLGFYTLGGGRVVAIQECPVQHPTNVSILKAALDAVVQLGLPIYNPQTRKGFVRGIIGMTSFATGEAMMVLCLKNRIEDPQTFVRAVLDKVPGLVSVMMTIQRIPTLEMKGPRVSLLWGKPYIEEEIAGIKIRIGPTSTLPSNPMLLPSLFQMVEKYLDLTGVETVVEPYAGTGVLSIFLAQRARWVIGVVPKDQFQLARESAGLNGAFNCALYTRDPARVLAKLKVQGLSRPLAVLSPPGKGASSEVIRALVELEVPRVVYLGRSLPSLARDVGMFQAEGYAVREVQPIDMLPHTSHLMCAVRMDKVGV
ncbi:MAG: 23S rRNA (uracil(1939)-C(5))-methyltransferase RlmD [Armatimonadota bacterium]|nr:23S rRNA (uracil(1939)-C(5))-methyltransferase RlmD [Armatimonadota bacterium]MDR5703671.1 23S rRNA (uracil(1939)-C(5))-methyltransferase RlmD [Armatimonadota bacterium]